MKIPDTNERFSQLLINALKYANYVEDYRDKNGSYKQRFIRDIFYLEDSEMEKILKDYIAQ